jgi:glycine dehydrogenase subunit 2
MDTLEPLSFDRSVPGRRGVKVDTWEGEATPLPPAHLLRDSVRLPEMSQGELVRYYTALSAKNYGIDSGTYPLGSCTMKYNPKVNDQVANLPGFARAHPLDDPQSVQGTLAILWELQQALGELTGLPHVSLSPAAGAQGELAGILMVKKALERRGDLPRRRRVLVPDSAHGTNPATAAMAGFAVTQIPTAADGSMDHGVLRRELDDTAAAIMVTQPSTLGLWERDIEEVARWTHEAGAFLYGDGANLNAILARARFGDIGFDVVHLNLHKTFSTPHGGGGPGAGPVCAGDALAPFLPTPVVARAEDGSFTLEAPEATIGRLQQFHGSAGVLIRACAYIRANGLDGLRAVSANAVLNANYLQHLLRETFPAAYPRRVLHEVVASATHLKRQHDIRALDVAKRLIDYGFHPPTIYFPLIVEEALMIEPTETESRESVERLAAALIAIAREAAENPGLLHAAPVTSPIGRLDEAAAARKPDLRWRPHGNSPSPAKSGERPGDEG